jgi:hypothetical protein
VPRQSLQEGSPWPFGVSAALGRLMVHLVMSETTRTSSAESRASRTTRTSGRRARTCNPPGRCSTSRYQFRGSSGRAGGVVTADPPTSAAARVGARRRGDRNQRELTRVTRRRTEHLTLTGCHDGPVHGTLVRDFPSRIAAIGQRVPDRSLVSGAGRFPGSALLQCGAGAHTNELRLADHPRSATRCARPAAGRRG